MRVELPDCNIKTHDSESRGQEEAGRSRRMSVLFIKTHDSESRGHQDSR